MSVNIELRGNHDTAEYKAGQDLKDIFDKSLLNATGHIVILTGVTLYGQPTKDIDLIAYGDLKNFKQNLTFRSKDGIKISEDVYFNNFCFCFETKRHPARDVVLDGLTLKVRYNGKLHDVTHQSEKQKYALRSFIEERNNKAPWICNFIWLTSLSFKSLQDLIGPRDTDRTRHNYLPKDFTAKGLFKLALNQKRLNKSMNGNYYFSVVGKERNIHDYKICSTLSLFTEMHKTVGDITRKKLELISKRLIKDQDYAGAIGKKLLIVSGRAGTGKTIKLLRLAFDLARNHNQRCLILTYNLALVSDIKRMLALARMPDDVDTYSVNIQTLHKFFYELAIGFGIGNGAKFIADFIEKYKTYLDEMLEYIKNGVIDEKDIQNLMKSRHDEIAWDYVLIDEAQDWAQEERDLIYRIFGSSKVIIADGVDQMIRSQVSCKWTRNIDNHRIHEKRCLRQKRNLVDFVNTYAEEFGLSGWYLEPIKELDGGKVIVSASGMPYNIFKREFTNCEQLGNHAYEMMFLCPPALVCRDGKKDKHGNSTRYFRFIQDFEKHGLRLWDGTKKDLRSSYPTDIDQHRLLQYSSCRGLEAWTVVCLQLDAFVKYTADTYKEEGNQQPLFPEDSKQRYIHLWSLIPLTRAIDTVVITLQNPNSTYAQRLKTVAEKLPDFVEWIE